MKENRVSLHLLFLEKWPILEQLRLEEALLRADDRNWCIVNSGSPPAIVMGISGKPAHLLDENKLKENPVPVIRRYSGGGTVYVDQNTFFSTLIFNSADISVPCCPSRIFAWSENFYSHPFDGLGFKLRENDYTIGERKFGGNAQYLTKNRWLLHTSFLWDYDPEAMSYLQIPAKAPAYRQGRRHEDFLCSLKEWIPSKEILKEKIELACTFHDFDCRIVPHADIDQLLIRPHRKSTEVISL